LPNLSPPAVHSGSPAASQDPPCQAPREPGGEGILRVAVGGPLAALFDYLPPPRLDGAQSERPRPGDRVLVPFGRGQRVGILVEVVGQTSQDPARLKRVLRRLDREPLLGTEDLALIRWAAAYYQQPLGEALLCSLPVRLRRPGGVLDDWVPGLRATAAGLALDPGTLGRAPRQRRLLELLRSHTAGLAASAVADRLGPCAGPLRELRAKGLVETCRLDPGPHDAEGSDPPEGPVLNEDQARAVDAVRRALGGFTPFLLEGVTGSGKTEVYIRLIQAAIGAGRQALVLVPEIGLTPQLRDRLARRLPGPLAVLHSALDEGERERAWHRAASGRAHLVLGTRSACFVPMPRLGLILVDEEHDASLKQQEGFRYSARDLAVRRAQQLGCPVVLGSATPSLETFQNARRGRYRWLRLPRRAGGAKDPAIALIDIRGQPLSAGLSPLLREHVAAQVGAGNQVLLFLNRRGFAPVHTCHDCGWVGVCPHCDARLTLHLRLKRLWCHHCGWFRPAPRICPECAGADLRTLGLGTERLEEELKDLFPEVPLARIDRDSTRRKGELDRLLAAVRAGETRILLGTQMLAKGHDFPGVTLVGILDLDQSLYAADFRAPERTAQLIVQVAGRAGRADRPGRVILQTRHPQHPLLQSLLREGYPGFAEVALAERSAAQLPPFSHLALLRADSPAPEPAMDFLRRARALAEAWRGERVQLLGPAPAPMERRAGRHRAQLLVECGERPVLQRFLDPWISALRALPRPGGLRWSIDVDPLDML
jgi:primosomal protein N' (replication factor Y) (superfamily II helicase)